MKNLSSRLSSEKIEFKNRLIFPPIATNKADAQGRITKRLLNYYQEKSHSGHLSMIITEHCFINPKGRATGQQISIAQDNDISGLSSLADVIHHSGTKATIQINHAGALGIFEEKNDAPSVIHDKGHIRPGRNYIAGRELSKEEIHTIADDFAKAAKRAKAAGFDGVEIHAAHGYLLNEFYSPLTNKRNDEYGITLAGRIRIHLEVIHAIRNAVGENYPLFLRFGALDYTEGGSTLEDAVAASKEFVNAGIDILDISGGLTGYERKGHENEQGYFSDVTQAIKQAVSVPVILTGGITELPAAEQLLTDKKADLIGIGRALIKNPSLIKTV